MTEKPFRDEDVVLRLPRDEWTFESVFVMDPKSATGFSMHWNVNGRWCPCHATDFDVAELLRQLQASQERCGRLQAVCEEGAALGPVRGW